MEEQAPFIYRSFSSDGTSSEAALLKAAFDGNLDRIKGVMKSLGIPNSERAAVFSFTMGGFGVLHCAACQGHLEVCKYLVEELGGDPNMSGGEGEDQVEGVTPFMASAQSGDISTVKYLFDHGGDLMKPDTKGRTVLHHAVCSGSSTVTEFLLSKGIPVDIDYGFGTPLYHACINEQDKTVKILLNHHANPNTVSCGIGTPLNGALIYRSLKCMKLLIKEIPVNLQLLPKSVWREIASPVLSCCFALRSLSGSSPVLTGSILSSEVVLGHLLFMLFMLLSVFIS